MIGGASRQCIQETQLSQRNCAMIAFLVADNEVKSPILDFGSVPIPFGELTSLSAT